MGWISLLAEITFTAGRFWMLLHLSGLKSPSQKERKLLPMARKQFHKPRPRGCSWEDVRRQFWVGDATEGVKRDVWGEQCQLIMYMYICLVFVSLHLHKHTCVHLFVWFVLQCFLLVLIFVYQCIGTSIFMGGLLYIYFFAFIFMFMFFSCCVYICSKGRCCIPRLVQPKDFRLMAEVSPWFWRRKTWSTRGYPPGN